MIVVNVTLVPGGYEPRRRDIGMLRISNASDLAKISDYHVVVMEAANPLTGSQAKIGDCIVERHNRVQTVWALVERAAAAAQNADLLDL
jgi:hypothetical protein